MPDAWGRPTREEVEAEWRVRDAERAFREVMGDGYVGDARDGEAWAWRRWEVLVERGRFKS